MFETKHRIAPPAIQAMHYQTLLQQIPRLRTCQAEMTHSVSQLEDKRPLGRKGAHLYVMLGLDMLAEMHAGAVRDLEEQRYLTAQTLARSGITHAINVLYVLGDAEADRLTGGLRHHLDARRERAEAWSITATAADTAMLEAHAQQLTAFCRAQPWYADAPRWPSLGERAAIMGVGNWVHRTLCVASSDEQALAQEVLNAMECEHSSSASEREDMHKLRNTKHGSDAVYLEAVSLWLFSQTLLNVANILRDTVAKTVAESAAQQMDTLLLEHERIGELLQREDNNVYFRIGG